MIMTQFFSPILLGGTIGPNAQTGMVSAQIQFRVELTSLLSSLVAES